MAVFARLRRVTCMASSLGLIAPDRLRISQKANPVQPPCRRPISVPCLPHSSWPPSPQHLCPESSVRCLRIVGVRGPRVYRKCPVRKYIRINANTVPPTFIRPATYWRGRVLSEPISEAATPAAADAEMIRNIIGMTLDNKIIINDATITISNPNDLEFNLPNIVFSIGNLLSIKQRFPCNDLLLTSSGSNQKRPKPGRASGAATLMVAMKSTRKIANDPPALTHLV